MIEGLQEAADRLDLLAGLVSQGKLKPETLDIVRSIMYKSKMETGPGYEHRGLQQVVRLLRTVDDLEHPKQPLPTMVLPMMAS